MKQIPLIPPLKGLSDAGAFENQPADTSTLLVNTSSIDPVTGRERFGPRAGCELYNDNQLAASKVQALVQSIADNRRTTFTEESTVVAGDLSEWDNVTPSKDSTPHGVPDGFGNIIAFDGPAALVKYNSAGVEVWRFSLPIKDDGQICRAICMDPFGGLYIGVSEGGAQSEARLWAFSPDDELHLKLRWTKRPGAFVERLRWKDGYLYSAENDIEGNRAYYALYEGADGLVAPEIAQRKDTRAAPINDLVVNSAGAVITTHEPSASRCLDPRYPDYSYVIDEPRWRPDLHLAQFKDRIWCHLDASKLKSQIDYTDLKDGDPVTIWRDAFGSQRKLIADPAQSSMSHAFVPPTYIEKGPCGRPAVRFSGDLCRLISELNPSEQESMADVQRTIVPGYKNCGYVLMIVCKPSESTRIERLFSQTNSVTAGAREIFVNWDGSGGNDPGFVHCDHSSASGTAPSSVFGRFSNKTSMAIITVLSGNGHYPVYGAFDSAFRVNGWPLCEYEANNFYSAGQSKTVIGCKDDETRGFTGDITDIFVLRDYTPEGGTRTLCTFPNYPVGTYNAASDTEIEQLEAWRAWWLGIPHMLDDGANGGWGVGGASSNTFKHAFSSDLVAPYVTQQGPPNPNGRDGDGTSPTGSFDIDMLSIDGVTTKWSPQRGNVKWVLTGVGMGYALEIDSEDNPYTLGPSTDIDPRALIKWLDRGDSATELWNDSSRLVSYGYRHPRLAIDKYDNLYVPFHWSTGSGATNFSLAIYDTDGASVLDYKVSGTLFGYGVVIDPVYPDYGNQPIERPEFVYLFTRNTGIASNPTVHRIRLVARVVTSGSPRNTALLAVCAGQLRRVSTGSGVPASISGPQLSATGFICAIPAFQKVFLFDGTTFLFYDPVTDITDYWKSQTAGELLANARWGCLWNGRIVLIRGDNASNWFMLEQGNPFGCDLSPAVTVQTQAVMGNNSVVGGTPDIINTVIPYSDERLIFGGDKTIHMLVGDPMAGGSIVLVSDELGMAFGQSWAKDERGAIYFFASTGGVYVMGPNSRPKSISDAIMRRMQDIDLDANTVTLAWNPEINELVVAVTPYGAGGTERSVWRWQRDLDAWHPDSYAHTELQPTCFLNYNADLPDDRSFIFGTEDGYLHRWSRTAHSDRGFPINCEALLGPYGAAGRELRLGQPTVVLASNQGGCHLEFMSAEVPDFTGDGVHRTELVAGRNATVFRWTRGSYCWVKLSSAAPGQRWSLESGTLMAVDVGRARVRS